jgi:hypothetical protein
MEKEGTWDRGGGTLYGTEKEECGTEEEIHGIKWRRDMVQRRKNMVQRRRDLDTGEEGHGIYYIDWDGQGGKNALRHENGSFLT